MCFLAQLVARTWPHYILLYARARLLVKTVDFSLSAATLVLRMFLKDFPAAFHKQHDQLALEKKEVV